MNPLLLHGLMWGIFAFVYIGLALGKYPGLVLDRAGIALVGGTGMLLLGALDIHQAASSINDLTILLLFGLMIFSAQLHEAGFYHAVGEKLTSLSARPKALLASLIIVSAVLSALLANDIVCLAFTPLLCAALRRAGRDPIPYLLALATSSNIGSASTLIGNPQNMYIGSASGLLFGAYFLRMLVPVAIGLVLCFAGVVVLFHKTLQDQRPAEAANHISHHEFDRNLTIKTLVLLAGLIGYFLLAGGNNAAEHRSIAALGGAGMLMLSHHRKAAKLYAQIDFNLIFLFLGLFVVNGAMSNQHLTDQIFSFIKLMHVDLSHPIMFAGVATILSNIVSNVPSVLLLAPAIHSTRGWYLLALVSTFAGNLTLVGSIANLIVAEGARKFDVKISLWTYCRLGIPLTIATVILGTLWLMWV